MRRFGSCRARRTARRKICSGNFCHWRWPAYSFTQPAFSQHSPNQKLAPSFHEEVLNELSQGSKLQEWMTSEQHVAWVEQQGGSRIVKLDFVLHLRKKPVRENSGWQRR